MIFDSGTSIAGLGARRAEAASPTQFDELFAEVDDLIKRVADVESPEIRKTRAKVHAALVTAKNALKNASHLGRAPSHSARAAAPGAGGAAPRLDADLDDALFDGSGQNLGIALLLGLGLGLIASLG